MSNDLRVKQVIMSDTVVLLWRFHDHLLWLPFSILLQLSLALTKKCWLSFVVLSCVNVRLLLLEDSLRWPKANSMFSIKVETIIYNPCNACNENVASECYHSTNLALLRMDQQGEF